MMDNVEAEERQRVIGRDVLVEAVQKLLLGDAGPYFAATANEATQSWGDSEGDRPSYQKLDTQLCIIELLRQVWFSYSIQGQNNIFSNFRVLY